ncbi:MAG: IS5 family transposase [Nanoarchaeota archaeon]|nr:IS5 family transposase [Nanoarchaeota archaeon]MCG2717389.1 IS5 family transposase [Nanoarchaeota archaeon]
MKNKDSLYLKFIDCALELCEQVPRYFSKFSNKIFCNHQKIILLVLKQKLRTTYRDLCELLKVSNIGMYIGLKRVPHYTTLVKFAKRVKPKILNFLLPFRKAEMVGVDGTGFEVGNRSMHYMVRTERVDYRRHIKLGISADMEKQIIFKSAIHKGPRHDTKDFLQIVKGLETNFVLADKGYDSKKNHKFVIHELGAKSLIKVRKNISKKCRSTLRKRVANQFDEKKYHQRSKVETIFSSIKRKYGSRLKAKTFNTQKKELICKLIAHNIDKLIQVCQTHLRVSPQPLNNNL